LCEADTPVRHFLLESETVTLLKINLFCEPLPKVPPRFADLCTYMVNSVSSVNQSQHSETTKAAAPKPQQTQQPSTTQPSDTVTLKSTGTAK